MKVPYVLPTVYDLSIPRVVGSLGLTTIVGFFYSKYCLYFYSHFPITNFNMPSNSRCLFFNRL